MGQQINLMNLSPNKLDAQMVHASAQRPDEHNMFSSLLDDVTYIANTPTKIKYPQAV